MPKKVILDLPDQVHFKHVDKSKVYACNDDGTTLLVCQPPGSREIYSAVSLTSGVKKNLRSFYKLPDMVRYLIQQGYTVFEFQSESELGAWLADQPDARRR